MKNSGSGNYAHLKREEKEEKRPLGFPVCFEYKPSGENWTLSIHGIQENPIETILPEPPDFLSSIKHPPAVIEKKKSNRNSYSVEFARREEALLKILKYSGYKEEDINKILRIMADEDRKEKERE